MASNNAVKTYKKGSTTHLTTRVSTASTVIINAVLLIVMVVCLVLYASDNKNTAFDQNVANISTIATAKSELAQTVMISSGTTVQNISNYCDGKTFEDAKAFVAAISRDSEEEYQLLTCTLNTVSSMEFSGVSISLGEDHTIKYTSASFPNLIYALKDYDVASRQLSYTTEFTNTYSRYKCYSVIYSMTLSDDGGTIYYLLNPRTTASLTAVLKTETQYPNLEFSVINAQGDYLVKGDSFRSADFFDYIYNYNQLTYNQMTELRTKMIDDTSGQCVMEYRDARDRLCTFAYARCDSLPNWYTIVSVPHSDFTTSEALIPIMPLVVIAVLVLLLLFDMIVMLRIISRLRVSVVNERYANQAKTDFLSRMSHDMRTPLNSIINFSSFIKDCNSLEEAKDFGDKVNKSGTYLLTLINDTLSMSRIETGHLEIAPVPLTFEDFRDGLVSVLGDKAAQKNVSFKIETVNLDEKTVLLDPLRLQQVFVNLLNNSIKFTPSGGRVELLVGSTDTNDGIMTLKFEVVDTGKGMSENFVRDKLFRPFAQERGGGDTEESGTGLGLSIAKSIVEKMGGTITCKSELGKGTTFTIIIPTPVVEDGLNAFAKQEEQTFGKSVDLKGRRILVCEDNALNRDIVTRLLDAAGCKTDMVENGKLGIEKYEKSSEYYYDAVLMDKRMPVMDGFEATKLIRLLNRPDVKDLPIIALSADVFEDHIASGMKIGMTSYLAKPIDPKELYKELSKCIEEYDKKRAAHN